MAVLRAYIEDSYVNKNGETPIYVSFYIAREKIVSNIEKQREIVNCQTIESIH